MDQDIITHPSITVTEPSWARTAGLKRTELTKIALVNLIVDGNTRERKRVKNWRWI